MLSYDDGRWNGLTGGRGFSDWNTYAIVATIELARDEPRNPELPEWLAKDYSDALSNLAAVGATELAQTNDPETVRAILSILAIGRGARTYGRMLLNYSQEELLDFESRAMI